MTQVIQTPECNQLIITSGSYIVCTKLKLHAINYCSIYSTHCRYITTIIHSILLNYTIWQINIFTANCPDYTPLAIFKQGLDDILT